MFMEWHVQFRRNAVEHIVWHRNPEDAIEAACLLIDDGVDVFGIGMGPPTGSIDREYVNRIYAIWARAKYPFTGQPS
jgi:hypothetical protein